MLSWVNKKSDRMRSFYKSCSRIPFYYLNIPLNTLSDNLLVMLVKEMDLTNKAELIRMENLQLFKKSAIAFIAKYRNLDTKISLISTNK